MKPQIKDKELRCLSYKNLSENAPWRQTLLNFEGYKRAALRQSPWAAFRGFHNQIIFRDWLHVVALGLGRDEVASAMWEIVHMDTVPGLRKDQQLGLLLQELRTWSRKAGRSIGKGLKSLPTYILKKKHPKMPNFFKGEKVLTMIEFLAIKTKAVQTGSKHSFSVATCCWALAEMTKSLRCSLYSGAFLSRDEKQWVHHVGQVFLDSYQWLSEYSIAHNRNVWRMKPKIHALCHLLIDVNRTGMNPFVFDCSADENFLGKMKPIARQ